MAEAGVRTRWRDALVLALLAAVIAAGLFYYGRALGEGTDRATHSSASPTATSSPSDGATAQLEGAPPADPATPPAAAGGTCWDGRDTASLRLCGLPEGARGLAWVFPSFERDRALCHRASPNQDSYPVVESYECFQTALGQAVTVTYDQVKDPRQVENWLLSRLGPRARHEIPGPHGGRYVFKDRANRPVRITGTYARFPYVVSVYASTPGAASRAWQKLVRQRPPEEIRGLRG